MAVTLTPTGVVQLASPNQASTIFNSNAAHPVRQKHLFVVRFVRDTQTTGSDWRENLSFVVKSIDRPTIQPVVEEINQYNKKRLIHTSVKYSPINVSFYDTADGAAMTMWLQYARYYFGDYVQNADSYKDDILNDTLSDQTPDSRGWGFNIRPISGQDIAGINSQHFFNNITVYQVWGGEFVSYELVNPRINQFVPDDLAYDTSEVNMVSMSLSFEAVNHINSGLPQNLSEDALLSSMFVDGAFNGNVIEVDGPLNTNNFTSSDILLNDPSLLDSGTSLSLQGTPVDIARGSNSSLGGVLGRFGNFDFGSSSNGLNSNLLNSVGQAVGGSAPLANILSGNFSGGISQTTGSLGILNQGIQGALGDNAVSSFPDLVSSMNQVTRQTGASPLDQVSNDSGLSLSDDTLSAFNNSQDGSYQIGFNEPLDQSVDPATLLDNSYAPATSDNYVPTDTPSDQSVGVFDAGSEGFDDSSSDF